MLDTAAVAKSMEAIAAGKRPAKAATKIFKALKKSSGAVAVGCEFKRTTDDTEPLSIADSVDFRNFGMKVRRSKASVLLVDCSTAAGKADCEEAVKEQQTAKGGFPGPMPVVRSGSMSSVDDIAEAKALGVEGVLLSMSEDAAEDMIAACGVLGMEAIAKVSSPEELDKAVAAGAKLVACDAALRASVPKDVGAVALLDSRVEEPESIFAKSDDEDNAPTPQVVIAMSQLKDTKFNAIIAMDALRKANVTLDRTFCSWLLEQISSKQSGMFSKLTRTTSLGQGSPLSRPDGILYEAQ